MKCCIYNTNTKGAKYIKINQIKWLFLLKQVEISVKNYHFKIQIKQLSEPFNLDLNSAEQAF